jgi:hypothetical protein
LVRSANGGPVQYILDWLQISMSAHYVEQVMHSL